MQPTQNLLIICDGFPPIGSIRAGCFAKYLGRLGWTVHIVTFKPDGQPCNRDFSIPELPSPRNIRWVRCIDSSHKKGIATFFYLKCLAFFAPEVNRPPGLVNALSATAEAVCAEVKIDCILATTSAYIAVLKAAHELSKKLLIPWWADLRDLYEQRFVSESVHWRERLFHVRAILRTRYLLKSASGISVVSEAHRKLLMDRLQRNVFMIPNGYDPEVFTRADQPQKSTKFRICYMGTLSDQANRDPSLIFAACGRLLRGGLIDKSLFTFDFYIYDPEQLCKIHEFEQIRQVSQVFPPVKLLQVAEILTSSAILVVLTSKNVKGVATTKLYEYLAIGRPIVCVPKDDGTIGSIIEQTNSGICTDCLDELTNFILHHYQKWQESGVLPRNSSSHHVGRYSREEQARTLHKHLIECVKGSQCSSRIPSST